MFRYLWLAMHAHIIGTALILFLGSILLAVFQTWLCHGPCPHAMWIAHLLWPMTYP